MELVDIKNKLIEFEKTMGEIKEALKIDEKRDMLIQLEQKTTENNFWEEAIKNGEVLKKINDLKIELTPFEKANHTYLNIKATYELLKEEFDEGLM